MLSAQPLRTRSSISIEMDGLAAVECAGFPACQRRHGNSADREALSAIREMVMGRDGAIERSSWRGHCLNADLQNSKLIQQVLDQVGAGDDADELGAVDDGDGVEVASGEHFGGFADGGGLLQGDRVPGHDILKLQGVVERGINRAFICVEHIAKADTQNVRETDDADKLVAIDDWDVVDTALFNDLADFGDRVAVVNGGDLGAHDFGDGLVAFHG